MNEKIDTLAELEAEAEGGFGDEFNYKKDKPAFRPRYQVKVWNPDPRSTTGTPTPGLILRKSEKVGDKWERTDEPVGDIEATLLYVSYYREVSGKDRTGKFSVRCSSHNGNTPSLSIDQPLCNDIKASDVADVFARWKGYDQAKVNAKVEEVTHGKPCLQVCGLKKADGGTIPICRYATKDAPASKQCKQYMKLYLYDHTNKREFTMQLSGASIRQDKDYLSPLHSFMKHCRLIGKVAIPYYLFKITLSHLANPNTPNFYILDVKNYEPISSPELRQEMKDLAHKSKEFHTKQGEKLSKEAYDKLKAKELDNIAAQAPEAKSAPIKKQETVSFEDDDIDF